MFTNLEEILVANRGVSFEFVINKLPRPVPDIFVDLLLIGASVGVVVTLMLRIYGQS